jgi:hypothetical protein
MKIITLIIYFNMEQFKVALNELTGMFGNAKKLDAGVTEAITKGPTFGDGKLLHAHFLE